MSIHNNSRFIIALSFLSVLTPLLLLPGFVSGLGTYDEGIPLVAASRILAGEIPHKDFWMLYPPGLAYLIAAGTFWTNSVILALRIIDLIARVVICLLILDFTRKTLTTRNRLFFLLFVWAVSISVLSMFTIQGYNVLQALALALVSIRLYGKSSLMSFVSGLALGSVALVRIDFFAYLLISYLTFSAFYWHSRKKIARNVLQHVRLTTIGLVSVLALPILTIIMDHELWSAVIEQLFRAPLYVFPQYRSIPYPLLRDIFEPVFMGDSLVLSMFIVTPVFLLVLLLYGLRVNYKSQFLGDSKMLLLLPLFGMLLLNQVRVRSDFLHLLPSLLILTITLLIVMAGLVNRLPQERMRLIRLLFTSCAVLLLFKGVYDEVVPSIQSLSDCYVEDISYDRCILKGQEERVTAVNQVKEMIPSTDRFLLVSDDNDNVQSNDVAFYVLVERLPLTRFHELHPGIVTTTSAQKEIVTALEKDRTRIIVRQTARVGTPTADNQTHGILDEYIHNNFDEVLSVGDYEILKRN